MKCVVLATGVGGGSPSTWICFLLRWNIVFCHTKCCVRLAASVCIRLVVWMSIHSWGSVNSATIGCDLCRPDLNDFKIQLRMHLFSTTQKPSRTETSTLVKAQIPGSKRDIQYTQDGGWILPTPPPKHFVEKLKIFPRGLALSKDLMAVSSDLFGPAELSSQTDSSGIEHLELHGCAMVREVLRPEACECLKAGPKRSPHSASARSHGSDAAGVSLVIL